MHYRRLVAVGFIAVVAAAGSQRVHSAPGDALLGIMQTELQRNLLALKADPLPAYFMSYTVHDTRTTRMAASTGALQRSEAEHSRVGSIEVRVGDYSFDSTHPLRGDFNAAGPR